MRIKLKEGYQKRLILSAKNNLTWIELSGVLKINQSYLSNELKNEERLLSKELYKRLCKIANLNFDCYIKEKLNDNWGRAKGGLNSTKKEELLIKEESEELAELIGIILGDGNIWVRKPYYYLTIVGDSKKDRNYLLNYVKPLFRKLFNKELHVRTHKSNNELFIYTGSKNVIFTLRHFGLTSGDKKKNNIKIPSWIFKSNKYIKACIRGLIDTDGCVCPITGRNYPYIWFSCGIENLRKSFDLAMKKLGIKTSNWNIRKNRTPDIYIGSKEMIKKYMQTISFKNKRHLTKMMPL
ncbi:MAG TPA: LAGLIDADG family homing endonuclease [Candidatus Nanoarchaeia archaeon]|nr:LAGLIDADG family homing endonuclease [Candidatus Nanoarchaeia archaeon]